MKHLTDKLEAILFSNKGGLTINSIERIIDADRESLENALHELKARYEEIDGALEIRLKNGSYEMVLKASYYGIVHTIIPIPVRDTILTTLTHIAKEQPVAQSTIIEIRGQKAYAHIRELVALKWLSKKRSGNTYILKTTKKFSEVFHCTEDPDEIRKLLEGGLENML
jgi:segregation and condensation protein B